MVTLILTVVNFAIIAEIILLIALQLRLGRGDERANNIRFKIVAQMAIVGIPLYALGMWLFTFGTAEWGSVMIPLAILIGLAIGVVGSFRAYKKSI